MKPVILSLLFSENNVISKSDLFDKPFRLNQISDFIFKKNIFEFDSMTNLSKELKILLKEKYNVLSLFPIEKLKSSDGTIKYLFELSDKNCIESVLLKDENERITFCISTQVGCRMGCEYCQTGKMGLIRNLDFLEILSQILYLSKESKNNFNIVFMGMGEPFDNFENLVKSINILTDNKYFGLSASRITVSTCGITDKISDFSALFPRANLALSLNSLIQEKREKLMPICKKYKLNKLLTTLLNIYKKNKKRITLEYVLIKDINDGLDEINAVKKIDKNAFLINIIPINLNDKNLSQPLERNIKSFCKKIADLGFNVTRRYRRGDDIKAACGQLYWDNKKNTGEDKK